MKNDVMNNNSNEKLKIDIISEVEKLKYPFPRFKNTHYLFDSVDLNMPIPFKAGDLVRCKLKPFSNNKNMLILSVGDNCDCCSVQVAFIDQYGKLRTGALKHTDMRSNFVFPCVSALYSLEKIDMASLTKCENISFGSVRNRIN